MRVACAALLLTLNVPTRAGVAPMRRAFDESTQAVTPSLAWMAHSYARVSTWRARQRAAFYYYRDTHPLADDLIALVEHVPLIFGMTVTISVRIDLVENYLQKGLDIFNNPKRFFTEVSPLLLDGTHYYFLTLVPQLLFHMSGDWTSKSAFLARVVDRYPPSLWPSYVATMRPLASFHTHTQLAMALLRLHVAERALAEKRMATETLRFAHAAASVLPSAEAMAGVDTLAPLLGLRQEIAQRSDALIESQTSVIEAQRRATIAANAAAAAARAAKSPAAPPVGEAALDAEWELLAKQPAVKAGAFQQRIGQKAAWRNLSPAARLQRVLTWFIAWWKKGVTPATAQRAIFITELLTIVLDLVNTLKKDPANDPWPEGATLLPLLQELQGLVGPWRDKSSSEFPRINAFYKLQNPSPLRNAVEALDQQLPAALLTVANRTISEVDDVPPVEEVPPAAVEEPTLEAEWKLITNQPTVQTGAFQQKIAPKAAWRNLGSAAQLQQVLTWFIAWWEGGIVPVTVQRAILITELLTITLELINVEKKKERDPLPEGAALLPLLQELQALLGPWRDKLSFQFPRINAFYKLQNPSPLRHVVEALDQRLPAAIIIMANRMTLDIDDAFVDLRAAARRGEAVDINVIIELREQVRAIEALLTSYVDMDLNEVVRGLLEQHADLYAHLARTAA